MSYKFFENKQCEYYPCHSGLCEINCLFCYCPLYDRDCGGTFSLLPDGTKDCSACIFPHKRENYDKVIKKLEK